MLKTALEASAYFEFDNFEEGIRKLKEHGYAGIDYGGIAKPSCHLYSLSEEDFKNYLVSIRECAKQNGVEISQVHALWPTDDTTEESRERMRAFYIKQIRATNYLGSRYLVIHPCMPFWKTGVDDPELTFRLNVELFRALLPYAKEYGVVLCVENMPFKKLAISRVETIKELVRTINDPYLKVCLDTGHANIFSNDIAADVRLLGDDLAVLHVHDNNGREDRHLIPYMGTIHWDEFLAALSEIGFSGVFSLETYIAKGMPEPMREEMRLSLSKLARYMADQIG